MIVNIGGPSNTEVPHNQRYRMAGPKALGPPRGAAATLSVLDALDVQQDLKDLKREFIRMSELSESSENSKTRARTKPLSGVAGRET